MRIFIKGFKSIAEGQYVALGKKLTFLVGPNSAGKSAIYAAISKLRQDAPLFELDVPSLHYKGKENNRALIQALGVEWEDEGTTIESRTTYVFYDFVDGEERMANGVNEGFRGAAQYFGDIFRDSESDDLFYRYLRWDSLKKNDFWNFEKITHERSDGKDRALSSFWSEFWNFEFDINEGSVFGLTEDVEGIVFVNAINFVKDMVPSAGAKNDPGLNELVKIFFSSVDDGFLRWNPALIKGIIFEIAKDREKQRLLNQFGHHDAKLKRYERRVEKKYLSNNPLKGVRLALVSADRVLPRDQDVEGVVGEKESENSYHLLMRSFVERDWGVDFEWASVGQKRGFFANQVNDALANDLFIDNGYQLIVPSSKITPREEGGGGENNVHGRVSDFIGEKFIVEMGLIDNHGRNLKFDEVGSGIGYVLPILIEAFNPKNHGGMVFLQQPELHLHPAMQASLADVLIQAAADRRIVAETHSEHMILRALKRIRQTYNENLLDKELQLTHEDVAVNYFEPQPDGSTKIHIIRIAPDGEFIDRWPRGFFAERDQELFDE